MLHILLLILKIIGIVVLSILGVLVLGIACALFVPVRYRIEVVRREGEGEPPVIAQIKVTWLLHFINVLVRFTGELFVRARIMIITVFRLPKRRQKSPRKKEKKREKGAADPERDEKQTAEKASGERPAAKSEARDAGQAKVLENGEDEGGLSATEEEPAKKPSLWDKLRALPEILRTIIAKIKSLFENIQYTIRNFCDKIRSISDTIEYYREVVEGEAFQRSFALCKGELLAICKSLKPQKFEASLVVGMDDPAATGQILAVCGMLYPFIGGHVDVAGDFEKKRLEGRVFVKGRIRFFTFLRVVLKVYFNKDIKKLYRLLKKEAV